MSLTSSRFELSTRSSLLSKHNFIKLKLWNWWMLTMSIHWVKCAIKMLSMQNDFNAFIPPHKLRSTMRPNKNIFLRNVWKFMFNSIQSNWIQFLNDFSLDCFFQFQICILRVCVCGSVSVFSCFASYLFSWSYRKHFFLLCIWTNSNTAHIFWFAQ